MTYIFVSKFSKFRWPLDIISKESVLKGVHSSYHQLQIYADDIFFKHFTCCRLVCLHVACVRCEEIRESTSNKKMEEFKMKRSSHFILLFIIHSSLSIYRQQVLMLVSLVQYGPVFHIRVSTVIHQCVRLENKYKRNKKQEWCVPCNVISINWTSFY